ncbi:hypothetical protein BD324DRAFT_639849 [Kockovaella imperatae]|uniref:Uncharacterized protein n=1 Tax=Kockovaella imperatae TaxID=4999 RepID=A0A1Y1U7D9_9TREE|nr:hypothetical protein BD324DRAFT_639849 [Kockovaella imperatae]ORX33454.1 hypothetical protein BD324DRAFT_639849 [Kockovaella imperatae]
MMRSSRPTQSHEATVHFPDSDARNQAMKHVRAVSRNAHKVPKVQDSIMPGFKPAEERSMKHTQVTHAEFGTNGPAPFRPANGQDAQPLLKKLNVVRCRPESHDDFFSPLQAPSQDMAKPLAAMPSKRAKTESEDEFDAEFGELPMLDPFDGEDKADLDLFG